MSELFFYFLWWQLDEIPVGSDAFEVSAVNIIRVGKQRPRFLQGHNRMFPPSSIPLIERDILTVLVLWRQSKLDIVVEPDTGCIIFKSLSNKNGRRICPTPVRPSKFVGAKVNKTIFKLTSAHICTAQINSVISILGIIKIFSINRNIYHITFIACKVATIFNNNTNIIKFSSRKYCTVKFCIYEIYIRKNSSNYNNILNTPISNYINSAIIFLGVLNFGIKKGYFSRAVFFKDASSTKLMAREVESVEVFADGNKVVKCANADICGRRGVRKVLPFPVDFLVSAFHSLCLPVVKINTDLVHRVNQPGKRNYTRTDCNELKKRATLEPVNGAGESAVELVQESTGVRRGTRSLERSRFRVTHGSFGVFSDCGGHNQRYSRQRNHRRSEQSKISHNGGSGLPLKGAITRHRPTEHLRADQHYKQAKYNPKCRHQNTHRVRCDGILLLVVHPVSPFIRESEDSHNLRCLTMEPGMAV